MKHRKILIATGLLLSIGTAQASLTAGISGGKSVVYDNVTNITWTEDANLLGTLEASLGYNTVVNAIIAASPIVHNTLGIHNLSASDFDSFTLGRTSWFGAQAFTTYLNNINYAGSNQWFLPNTGPNPQFDFNQTGTQLGELFYNELGGIAGKNIPNTSSFSNEKASGYWFSTEYTPNSNFAWLFDTFSGFVDIRNKAPSSYYYAWAISPGNVAAVPVPAALWLFGSAMLGLMGINRQKLTPQK